MTPKQDDMPAVPRRWMAANILLGAILIGIACIAAVALVTWMTRAGG